MWLLWWELPEPNLPIIRYQPIGAYFESQGFVDMSKRVRLFCISVALKKSGLSASCKQAVDGFFRVVKVMVSFFVKKNVWVYRIRAILNEIKRELCSTVRFRSVLGFSVLFLSILCFLKKKLFFNGNRVYLLGPIICLSVLPWLRIWSTYNQRVKAVIVLWWLLWPQTN